MLLAASSTTPISGCFIKTFMKSISNFWKGSMMIPCVGSVYANKP